MKNKNPQKSKITLSAGEYITRVYGRCGSRIDQICFETSDGDVYEFGKADGGEPFDCEIPAGYALGALTGGTNGHLHNFVAWFGKINMASQGLPMIQYYTLDQRFTQEHICGQRHDDSEDFGDNVDYNDDSYRLDSIKIYANHVIQGFQFTYEINGQYYQGERFFGSKANVEDMDYEVKILNLDIDEFIVFVEGYSGSLVDSLKFVTNKGKELQIGGDGGTYFQFGIPEGHCVGYINGCRNGDIHTMRIVTGPIPIVLKSNMKRKKY